MSTLIIMSLLLMLILSLIEQQRWQEKLATQTLQSEQRRLEFQKFMQESLNDIQHRPVLSCSLAWNSLENTWALLENTTAHVCIRRKNNMEIRYVLVPSRIYSGTRIDVMARVDDKSDWQYLQMNVLIPVSGVDDSNKSNSSV